MQFAVYGAGAVGCYYGGMLAQAGHDVVLIGRENHVAAMSERGLRFQSGDRDIAVPVRASTAIESVRTADYVLVCVKSTDTIDAALALRDHLSPSCVVVSLQNGVDNAQTLRGHLDQPVISTAVYVASEMAGPGHLLHHGRGDLVIEATAHSEQLADVLRHARIPTRVSPDVRTALWEKLLLNCAYNAASAIVQLPLGDMSHRDALRDTMRDVVGECLAVASAEGVELDHDAHSFVELIERTIPAGQYSSTAQDLARGRPSEIDFLNGAIVRRGTALGIPTPANRTLHTLVKMLEAKAAPRIASPAAS